MIEMDPRGKPAPEATGWAPCCMTATVNGVAVACGLPEAHRGLHGWSGMGGPTGSVPPGLSGAERSPEGRERAMRAAQGGRRISLADLCAERSKDGRLLCGHEPGHGGAHSFSKQRGSKAR